MRVPLKDVQVSEGDAAICAPDAFCFPIHLPGGYVGCFSSHMADQKFLVETYQYVRHYGREDFICPCCDVGGLKCPGAKGALKPYLFAIDMWCT